MQVPRRNHIFAIERGAFSGRGTEFTNLATSIRCVRADESGQTISVHYLNNGSANVRVVLQKQEFFIPVLDPLTLTHTLNADTYAYTYTYT